MKTGTEYGPQADFFVHPDYHRLSAHPISGDVELYEAALHEKIDHSPLPILIYDPVVGVRAGDFWDRFPPGQRFQSLPDRGILDSGHETHASFNRLLSEQEVLRGIVHGSYLEQCVRMFKRRLCVFGRTGILYTHSPYEIGYVDDIFDPDTVKYGLVLRDTTRPRPFPEFHNLESGLPPRHYAEDAQIFSTGDNIETN